MVSHPWRPGRQVHAQQLASHQVRRIVRQKMHAGNHGIDGQYKIASVGAPAVPRHRPDERARTGERTKVSRDQGKLGGSVGSGTPGRPS